ncbi:MAG: hypothetical protein HC830_13100, partial [Bacteroidetes bacterium]|nr:hypothetical protein [Bacteroidota bacterium]
MQILWKIRYAIRNHQNDDPISSVKIIPGDNTENGVPRCTLTDEQLLEKCREWINKLCNIGGRAWVLHIPARLNEDPDLLWGELTWRFKKMLRTVSGTGKNDDTVPETKNDVTILNEIAHKLILFTDVKVLAFLGADFRERERIRKKIL